MTDSLDFLVKRDDLHTCRFEATPDQGELQEGQVLLRVDRFAFTSNNVTYAAFGEAMSYWNFFPAPEGWGRIPVWGFADVMQSRCEGVKNGQRFYGYFPMSKILVVQPARVSESGFFDASAHRQALHPLYNQYLDTSTDPVYDAAFEDQLMLLRPLFITSFMIDDFLDDNQYFGARSVMLSSASSKTAYGLAYLLKQRGQCEVIGLTSTANLAFTESLGCYHRVLTYEQLESLPRDLAVTYVDMAGNANLRKRIHRHFEFSLKYSCAVGGTHWDQGKADAESAGEKLPGPRATLFFAPAQIKKRMSDWGPNGVMERFALAWKQFLTPLSGWMHVVRGQGQADVERVYLDMVEGRSKPDQGNVLSLFD